MFHSGVSKARRVNLEQVEPRSSAASAVGIIMEERVTRKNINKDIDVIFALLKQAVAIIRNRYCTVVLVISKNASDRDETPAIAPKTGPHLFFLKCQ